MDRLNIDVYVQQVTHDADRTLPSDWERNDEDALNSVVDPNTEFKHDLDEKSKSTPSESYRLTNEEFHHTEKQEQVHQASTFQLFEPDPVIFQLKTALQDGFESNQRKKSLADFHGLAKVHNYVGSSAGELQEKIVITNTSNQEDEGHITSSYLVNKPEEIECVIDNAVGKEFLQGESDTSDKMKHKDCIVPEKNTVNTPVENIDTLIYQDGVVDLKQQVRETVADKVELLPFEQQTAKIQQTTVVHPQDKKQVVANSTLTQFVDSNQVIHGCNRDADHRNIKGRVGSLPHLVPYPLDRITVMTEKRSSLNGTLQHGSTTADQLAWAFRTARDELETASNCSEAGSICSEKAETMSTISDVSGYEEEMFRIRRLLLDPSASPPLTSLPCLSSPNLRESELRGELQKMVLERDSWQAEHEKVSQEKQDLQADAKRWRCEAELLEASDVTMRRRLQDLRSELESRNAAVIGLKHKVAKQHTELQEMLQARLRAESNYASSQLELESLHKSVAWYREQLHACQAAKSRVQQDLMSCQASLMQQIHLADRLSIEATNTRRQFDEVQQRTVNEKEALLRKLEAIQVDLQSREEGQAAVVEQIQAAQVTLIDTRPQLDALKVELQRRHETIRQLEERHSQVMVRVTTLQKTLNEKEGSLHRAEERCRHVEMCHQQAAEDLKARDQMLHEAKNTNVALEVALSTAAREKAEVHAAIEKLRDDFTRVSKNYQCMKSELDDREASVQELRHQIHEMEKEKANRQQKFENMQRECMELRQRSNQAERLSVQNMELTNRVGELTQTVRSWQEKVSKSEEQLMKECAATNNLRAQNKALESQLVRVQGNELALAADVEKLNLQLEEETEKYKSAGLSALNAEGLSDLVNKAEVQLKSLLSESNFKDEQCLTEVNGNKVVKLEALVSKLMIFVEHLEEVRALKRECTDQVQGSSERVQDLPVKDVSSTSTQTTQDYASLLGQEIQRLKGALRVSDVEKREKQRRYETNIRTLLKKVKEHLRSRRAAERQLEVLHSGNWQEQFNEERRKADILLSELRREVQTERCDAACLRRELTTLKMALSEANSQLQALHTELGDAHSHCELLEQEQEQLRAQVLSEQAACANCERQNAQLKAELQQVKAKDPVLADQIKTLSYHMHLKTQELAALQEHIYAAAENHKRVEEHLEETIASLRGETTTFLAELDALRKDKHALLTQITELRAALQSSLDHGQTSSSRSEPLPNVATSPFPAPPPTRYNEERIAQLLLQSAGLPQQRPLSNLQNCVDSLKVEMATLQAQLEARTSPRKRDF